MWPSVIIGPSPVLDHHPGLCQALEELGIKTFTAKRAVEAFVTDILPGFTGFNSARGNLLLFQKGREILGNEFWTDSTQNRPRLPI